MVHGTSKIQEYNGVNVLGVLGTGGTGSDTYVYGMWPVVC